MLETGADRALFDSEFGKAVDAKLQELYDSVVSGKPLWHDGRWGMATLEVCLAIMSSARDRQEVMLEHQVPVREDYDADFEVAGFN